MLYLLLYRVPVSISCPLYVPVHDPTNSSMSSLCMYLGTKTLKLKHLNILNPKLYTLNPETLNRINLCACSVTSFGSVRNVASREGSWLELRVSIFLGIQKDMYIGRRAKTARLRLERSRFSHFRAVEFWG